ncbi:MAG TPA: hypothetical protein VF041_19080 [Gemmatimonadaceae bacterium]
MHARFTAVVSLTLAALVAPTALDAQDTTATRDSLARRVQQLERTVDSLRATAERQDERLMELDERSAAQQGVPAQPQLPGDTTRRTIPSARGIYGKPFVKRFGGGTAIGGYVDFEYTNDLDGHASSFDQHRLIPFLFAEITDRLHFGTEIEFEHGGNVEVEDGKAGGGGEINVEFATLDYRISEAFNVRGGIVLSPLGRFNLVHDSPVNELTDRPLLSTYVEPTTLSESGFGFFGTTYPSERTLLSYELYVVNGFTPGIFEVEDDGTALLRVREGRGLRGEDDNFAKSVVGRVAFSPFLGLELGASAHTGKFAARDGTFSGDERLTIWGVDATWQRGPVELLGEYGQLHTDVPATLAAAGAAGRQNGYYVQGSYHFGHGVIPPRATSVFTGTARWDHVDLDRDASGDALDRLTVGVNWRPVPDAVLKTDFQWNWNTPPGSTDRGDVQRRLLLSMAAYF